MRIFGESTQESYRRSYTELIDKLPSSKVTADLTQRVANNLLLPEEAFCEAELIAKGTDPSYQITSEMAKKVYKIAPSIVAPGVTKRDILLHPEAFRLLVAGPYHFHKHIQTLKSWGQYAGVYIHEGNVLFHSGEDVLATSSTSQSLRCLPELECDGIKFGAKFMPTFKTAPREYYSVSVVTDQVGHGTSIWGHPHCWMRIYTPSGEVYAFGKGDLSESTSIFSTCKDKKGGIDSGDVHEWFGHKTADGQSTIQEHKIQISAEEFERLKKRISTDINDANCTYSLMNNDCADWVLNVLEEEVIIDSIDRSKMRTTLLACLMPSFINQAIESVCRATPTIKFPGRLLIANVVMALPRALNNLIVLILGQWTHEGSFKRFFTETARFTHPNLVRKHAEECLPRVSKGLRSA